jgi:hypothetical protein
MALPLGKSLCTGRVLWFLALAVVGFSLTAVENITVLSMLSLSQAHAKAEAADGGLFQALGVAVASARNGAHHMNLIVGSSIVFVLYFAFSD